MRSNQITQLWKEKKTIINGWLTIPCAWTAELMAHQGFDSLTVDMQHGLMDYATALTMLQAISTTDTVPLVRIPWNEPGILMRMLDAGAYWIICPMINNRAEAEAYVAAGRYAPLGMRSYGPSRAALYAGEDYLARANDTVLLLAMIETREALEKVDEIVSTEGLDGIYLGPADLSHSLGIKKIGDYQNPLMKKAVDQILEAVVRHNKLGAAHASNPEDAAMLADRGFHLVTPAHDTALLEAGAKQALIRFRQCFSR